MRTYLPAYEMQMARDLDDALKLLAADPGAWRPFAGGTDLMVLLESGALSRGKYLSIWDLSDLRGICVSTDAVAVGALTTYTAIRNDPTLQHEFPLLCRAAAETGSVAIQNRGTIGGNIANASPAADTPPALLVYDAELELVSIRGTRRLPYRHFHQGYKQMDLEPDELIASVRLPRGHAGGRHYYRKVGTRRAQAISKVCFAGVIDAVEDVVRDVRIAMGSVAPVPLRCARTEHSLRNSRLDAAGIARAHVALLEEISPIDDLRSTAAYRRRVSLNLLDDFLRTTVSVSS